jgi:hypothetical protein
MELELPQSGPSGLELRGYHSKEAQEDDMVTRVYYVRWVSSRTLREAANRRIAILKPTLELPATKSPQSLRDFQLVIASADMSAFQHAEETKLKAKSYLAVSSHRRIAASGVEITRSSDGRVKTILFSFPQKDPHGRTVHLDP